MSAFSGGFPGVLPAGERLLWQGKPSARGLARGAMHLRGLTVYFGALLVFSALARLHNGAAPGKTARAILELAGVAAVPLLLLGAFALTVALTTRYAITTRRVVLRFGIAVPRTLNLPFTTVAGADANLGPDGSGDISLRLDGATRLNHLLLWPHVRPWRLGRPEPMLRAVPDAARAASVLARALAQAAAMPVPAMIGSAEAASTPQPHAQAAA